MAGRSTYSDDELVSLRVAALIAGVHTNTLRRYISRGRLPASKTPGGHLRIKVADVRPDQLNRPIDDPAVPPARAS